FYPQTTHSRRPPNALARRFSRRESCGNPRGSTGYRRRSGFAVAGRDVGFDSLGFVRMRRILRQEKDERGAFAVAIAVGGERAAQLFDGQRAAVQAEAVAVAARGE